MSIRRIGIEKALPMLLIGISCILTAAIIFGILCGKMIRKRRLCFLFLRKYSQERAILISNTNQSAAILSSTTKIDQYHSSSSPSRVEVALDPTFKVHPYHLYSVKRIIEL
ncbi:unnamed protein product [Rotaria magnacalcarata]|uniref:Uncharacterized protein n=1 Tax=Rotaria magnacalcarata TaxID=392030 RepID=A0A815EB62_9BILA|nr:unnamed protein product [Rotaria magnacalcarata]CAF2080242.1 unnamed protein product [Rotaria magnacalcarata]